MLIDKLDSKLQNFNVHDITRDACMLREASHIMAMTGGGTILQASVKRRAKKELFS